MKLFRHVDFYGIATSLKSKLDSYDYTATTEGGYQWLRKALHPAEETIKSPRMPCHGTHPTATQECTMTFVVESPDSTIDSTWSARIAMKNDPLCPVEIYTVVDSSPDDSIRNTVLNQCFCPSEHAPYGEHSDDTYAYVRNLFRESCEQYRTTALSVTGYFIGASLTDQGSIVSAQTSDSHQDFTVYAPEINHVYAMPRGYAITQNIPTVDALMMGTNAYMSPAREGFYVPYKLGSVGRWFSSDNVAYCYRFGNIVHNRIDMATSTSMSQAYPFGITTPATTVWLPPLDDAISVTHIRNVAKTTSFRLTVRIAIEMMTRPDSHLAAYTELPALPDEHALHMYSEIVSRMKDAYPAVDNSRGSLWRKVKDIASGVWDIVSPALANTPLAPVAIAGNAVKELWPAAEKAFRKVGDKARKQRVASAKAPKPAAAMASAARSQSERASANGASKRKSRRKKKMVVYKWNESKVPKIAKLRVPRIEDPD